jgi:hypothetical protein
MISGVQPTDTIQFVVAGGIASFAEDTENEGVGAFAGLLLLMLPRCGWIPSCS